MVSATKVVEIQVKLVEGRVNRLRTDFNRYSIRRKPKCYARAGKRLAPGQRPVILLDKTAPQLPQLPSSL